MSEIVIYRQYNMYSAFFMDVSLFAPGKIIKDVQVFDDVKEKVYITQEYHS